MKKIIFLIILLCLTLFAFDKLGISLTGNLKTDTIVLGIMFLIDDTKDEISDFLIKKIKKWKKKG